MNSSLPVSKTQTRLAIIDNDGTVLRDLYEFFSAEGYAVSTFRTAGRQMFSTIVKQVSAFRPHLVILDLRLSSQADEDDLTGLILLRHLLSARCILYSSFITAEVLDEAEKALAVPTDSECYSAQHRVYRHRKTRSPENLIREAKQLAETMSSAMRPELLIRHPRTWNLATLVKTLGEDGPPLSDETIADVLVQLYPNSSRFVLEAMDGAIMDIHSASSGRSVVLKLYRDSYAAVALKITHTQDGLNECENYTKYIKGRLNGGFHTTLEKFVIFWDVAGSTYKFIGSTQNSVITFSQFYQSELDPQIILAPLEHLFKTVWMRLYNAGRAAVDSETERNANTLFDLYEEDLKLRRRFDRLEPEQKEISNELVERKILNPVWWLLQWGEDSVILPTTYLAVTHGDLHGDNIYVEREFSWVIDFERTGWGHILRDFTELETDIVTRLLAKELDNNTFVCLLRALVAPHHPSQKVACPALVERTPEAYKAFHVIVGLREIAQSVTGYQDQREYLWGLLFDATFIGTRRRIEPKQKERSILFASIIATRLDAWGKPWSIIELT